MPRPLKTRLITASLRARSFKPQGIPMTDLEVVELTLDQLEALRLVDAERADQGSAAAAMGISPSTLSRLLAGARHRVADALVAGKAIRIAGGPVAVGDEPETTITRRPGCGRGPRRAPRATIGD